MDYSDSDEDRALDAVRDVVGYDARPYRPLAPKGGLISMPDWHDRQRGEELARTWNNEIGRREGRFGKPMEGLPPVPRRRDMNQDLPWYEGNCTVLKMMDDWDASGRKSDWRNPAGYHGPESVVSKSWDHQELRDKTLDPRERDYLLMPSPPRPTAQQSILKEADRVYNKDTQGDSASGWRQHVCDQSFNNDYRSRPTNREEPPWAAKREGRPTVEILGDPSLFKSAMRDSGKQWRY